MSCQRQQHPPEPLHHRCLVLGIDGDQQPPLAARRRMIHQIACPASTTTQGCFHYAFQVTRKLCCGSVAGWLATGHLVETQGISGKFAVIPLDDFFATCCITVCFSDNWAKYTKFWTVSVAKGPLMAANQASSLSLVQKHLKTLYGLEGFSVSPN